MFICILYFYHLCVLCFVQYWENKHICLFTQQFVSRLYQTYASCTNAQAEQIELSKHVLKWMKFASCREPDDPNHADARPRHVHLSCREPSRSAPGCHSNGRCCRWVFTSLAMFHVSPIVNRSPNIDKVFQLLAKRNCLLCISWHILTVIE